MNKILSSFLNEAALVQKENQRIDNFKKLKSGEEEIEQRRKLLDVKVKNPLDNETTIATNRIQELGFTILSHEREMRDICNYTSEVDVYYCEYEEWRFVVEWHSDIDIEEGILSLKKATHKINGIELDVNCDLFCNNTSVQLLEKVKSVFNSGYEAYINKTYGHYLQLPTLLASKGFVVKDHNLTFSLAETKGCLQIDEQIYLHVKPYEEESMMLFVTNFQHWTGNASKATFELNKGKELRYPFPYKGHDNVDELCKCIQALKEHMEGEFGYRESSAQDSILHTYYNHYDFIHIFTSLKNEIKKTHYDYWNHYLVKYERAKHRGKNGLIDNAYAINHYKGLEIHETVLFSLNDAAQWTIGEECIQYLICFVYDKRIDNTSCSLKIVQWIAPINHSLSSSKFEVDEESPYCKGVYEQKGTFTELTTELKTFLYKNLSLQGIQI